ncbi:extracellular solute-binding protein [Glycomyces tenuis]|uniref:extracellular solute-binding protein n=1 Tax=Glycomyces tenuis TaxID=58116 RepID=UPI000410FF90|nr:extracellular solute-binding protein [Glycomyces tenuis]
MATPSGRSPVRRRSLFKAAGLGTAGAAGLPLMSACGEVSGGDGNVQEVDQTLDILPEYKEWPLPIEPDLVGEPPNHPSGYLQYPNPPAQAITNTPSNSGSYQVYVPNWGPTPEKDDPYFLAMQEATGGTKIEFVQSDGEAFNQASGQWIQAQEFGDAIFMFGWMANSQANFNETVVNRFADISGLVSGDISERWPLLAGRGDAAWADSVWSTDPENPQETAGIYGVPWELSGGPGNGFFYRADLMREANLEPPTTVEELLEIARTWSDHQAGRWAIGGTDYMSRAWFRLEQSGWLWDGSGLVNNNERPEFKEWVTFQRTLTDEQLRHPNVGTPDFDGKTLQRTGEILFDQDGWNRWWQITEMVRASGEDPDFELHPVGALTYEDREPMYHAASGVGAWLFFRKDLGEDAIAELLDVSNYVAAPYGTKEFETVFFGFEGEQFEYDADGRPAFTEAGVTSFQDSLTYTAMGGRTQYLLEGPPDIMQARFEFDEQILPYLDSNPFQGLRLTSPEAGTNAGTVFDEKVNDIIYGRAELSELDSAIETWKADGGDEAREFYEKAYKQLHGE